MRKLFLIALAGILWLQNSAAQKRIEYGIKAGANMSIMTGASEKDASGNKLEKNGLSFRIFAGAYARFKLADRFGVVGEFNYIQKGGTYEYNGPSFDKLSPDTTGSRIITMNTSLNYMEVPVMAYFEVIKKKLEVSVGPSLGFLAGATAVGNTKYFDPNVESEFGIEYDYSFKYFKDKAQGIASSNTHQAVVNGNVYYLPDLIGAYYFNTAAEKEAKGNFYNRWDLALNAGFTWRASGSLRLGFRFQYSLLDITNNAFDASKQTENTPRADRDGNMGFQLSLGFGF